MVSNLKKKSSISTCFSEKNDWAGGRGQGGQDGTLDPRDGLADLETTETGSWQNYRRLR